MEGLNDDILLTIFDFLDDSSICKAAEVNKRWNRLISSITPLIKRLTLAIDIAAWKDDVTSSDELLETLSNKLDLIPFRNFKLTSNSHLHSRERSVMNIFREKSQKIEKLCLKSFSGGLMLSMLRLAAPTLTHLIISTSFSDEEYIGFADLPNLQYLKISAVDSILKVIKCDNLRSLDILNCRDREALAEFLENSNYLPHLKSLTTFHLFWMIEDLTELPFELESLTLTRFSSVNPDLLHEFLLTQAKSLKNLILMERQVQVSIVNFMMDNLRNLESLKIHGSLLNACKDHNESKLRNLSLKSLEFKLIADHYSFPGSPEVNEARDVLQILSKCKNLEKLKFQGSVSTLNGFVTNLPLPKLKSLEIDTIRQFSFWNCLELPNLEHFTLQNLNCCPGYMNEMLNFLPKLTKLRSLQINAWPCISHQMRNMTTCEMKRFFEFLSNFESLKIKNSENMPKKLLHYFGGFDSETFKLLEISCFESEQILDKFRNKFKSAKFQTIFNKSEERRESEAWEDIVEDMGNHDEDENDNRSRKVYRSFMVSTLYPNY